MATSNGCATISKRRIGLLGYKLLPSQLPRVREARARFRMHCIQIIIMLAEDKRECDS